MSSHQKLNTESSCSILSFLQRTVSILWFGNFVVINEVICYYLKEEKGNVLSNDALKTFYLWLYDYEHMVKEGRKENLLFNDALNTFNYGYMVLDIW